MAYTVRALIKAAQEEQRRLLKEKERITEDFNHSCAIINEARRLLGGRPVLRGKGRAKKTTPPTKKRWSDGWTVSRTRVTVDIIRATQEITQAELEIRLNRWYPKGFSWPSLNFTLKRWIKKMGGIKIEGRGKNKIFKTAKKKNLKQWDK